MGPNLTTMKDVFKVLFLARIVGMIKNGSLDKVIAYTINWLYTHTMECGDKEWIVRGWDSYTTQWDLQVSLGDISNNNHVNRTHSAIKAAKQTASTSFLTQFKREAMTK